MIDVSRPWQVLELPPDEFLVGMIELGTPQQLNVVGSFAAPDDQTARTAHRDTDLPWHRDGIRSEAIADMQGGSYIEAPGVDVVGMFCLRSNTDGEGFELPCWTVLAEAAPDADPYDDSQFRVITEVDLSAGQALVWDNRLWHRRHGPVGNRLLVRFWSSCLEVRGRELAL